ncbi:hypothetical protein MNB_SV-13-1552 [hydrothermal vent metagenome]|uniref:Uncharacterized protein n=1 Tax=hydrothermal vent metagenome TaxID=652676 RepID=A0A1W1CZ51_9ZZZZ
MPYGKSIRNCDKRKFINFKIATYKGKKSKKEASFIEFNFNKRKEIFKTS